MKSGKEIFCVLLERFINKKRCDPSEEYREPECIGCIYAKEFRIKKRLTNKQIRDIIIYYNNGFSCSEISKRYGIKYKKVFDILLKYKVWRFVDGKYRKKKGL